ncbi:MAG: TlpA family protein disulfide reductase [Planctomycetota bacterium]|jgi:thiol-disulfide isomerase/thioredoxin
MRTRTSVMRPSAAAAIVLSALMASPASAGAVQPDDAPAMPTPAPTPVSPEAAPLLAKLEAAMAAIEAGGYRVRMSTEMGDIRSELTAEVRFGRRLDPPVGLFLRPAVATMRAASGETMLASFDGAVLRHQVPARREVHEIRFDPGGGFPMMDMIEAMVPGLCVPGVFIDRVRIELGEPVRIGEQMCPSLRGRLQERMDMGGDEAMEIDLTQIVVIDPDTNLPLRFESRFRVTGGAEMGPQDISRRLDLLEPIRAGTAPEDFAVPVPEGWRLVDASPAPAPESLAEGEPAPAFDLEDFDGRRHRLSDYRGKVVLLDFWATWCGPCIAAMPKMQSLHERYADRGLVVAGIAVRENSREAPVTFFREKGYGYLALHGDDAVTAAYDVRGIPLLVLIGPDGTVAMTHLGMAPDLESMLATRIEQLLPEE